MSGARKYAKLLIAVWREEDWMKLPADAQWLYALLLSQPTLNTAGVLPIQLSKWSKGASDMTVERVTAAAKTLADCRFIVADHDTEEVLIRSFVRHDIASAGTPKMLIGALNAALQVQSQHLRAALLGEFQRLDLEHRQFKGEQRQPMMKKLGELEASVAQRQQHPSLQQQQQRSLSNGYPKASESLCEKCGNNPADGHMGFGVAAARRLRRDHDPLRMLGMQLHAMAGRESVAGPLP